MDNELEKLLPCAGMARDWGCKSAHEHTKDCPAFYRPALAEKLKAAEFALSQAHKTFGAECNAMQERLKAQRDEVLEEAIAFCHQISQSQRLLSIGEIRLNISERFSACAILATGMANGLRALKSQPDLSGAKQAVVEAASKLKFGAYPAHGSGLVLIVTDGNVDELRAALDALQSAQAKGGA